MTDARYLEPSYAARYLEAEWGDLVLKHASFPEGHSVPFGFQDRNVLFYTSVVRMLKENLQTMPDFSLRRLADFGCASGRLVREVCEAFDTVEEVIGYEPSPLLCGLARQMVLGDPLPERLPTSDLPSGDPRFFLVTQELRAAVRHLTLACKAKFFVATVESALVPAEYFDVVCCLNVLDRHPDPRALVEALRSHARPGGLLCISSPLEWQQGSTPSEHWRDSVNDFLDAEHWQTVDQRDIDYQFRINSRRLVQYSSQVVLVRRRA